MLIRKATIKDVDYIYTIECETYINHHWSKKTFESELLNDFSTYFVFEVNSNIVAYTGYWIVGDEGHITTMVVSSKYRRVSIADILLYNILQSAICNHLKWITLEVRVSNIPAISLYTKYDFKQLGIRKNYYNDNNEDALILWSTDISSEFYKNQLFGIACNLRGKSLYTDILHY